MVKLHDGSVMILGGYPVIYETKSLIFNPINGSFSAGPELTYGRIYPGVALINRSIFTNIILITNYVLHICKIAYQTYVVKETIVCTN